MRSPACVAARRPLPAAIAWPDAMSGHFFLTPNLQPALEKPPPPPGRPEAGQPPSGGSKRAERVRRGAFSYFIPKRPSPFMPPMARIILAMPPFFICFIMPCICSN